MRQVYDYWQDRRQHTRLEERRKWRHRSRAILCLNTDTSPRRHAISLTSISRQRTLPTNKVTPVRTPRISDLPLKSGRGGVKADKLHAMIHVIVGRVAVSRENTAHVMSPRRSVHTDRHRTTLRHSCCEGCFVLIVAVQGGTAYFQDVTEATWFPSHLQCPVLSLTLIIWG